MEPLEQNQIPAPPAASANERRLSLLIMGLLVLIAGLLVYQQSRFDAAAWRERAPGQGTTSGPMQKDAADAGAKSAVDGLVPMSAPESYDAQTLSDKINGKAELYLSAGFKGLETRRFSLAADGSVWLERYVYDMGRQRNAFAVYSSQRRRTATPLDFVRNGFLSSNGLFFIHGSHYVEIIAADVSEQVQAKMKALAVHFVKTHADTGSGLPEPDLFPPAHRVADATMLIADSAFGLAGFNWVYTALYQDGAAQATAFLMRCDSTAEAQSLAAAFTGFWTEYGGEAVAVPDILANAEAVTILDNFEIVLVQGAYLLGTHEATDLQFGAEVTARLQQMVKEQAQ